MLQKRATTLTFLTVELLDLLPHVANVIRVMHPHTHAWGWCDALAMLLS
jgi:hypothetical protein